VKSLVADETVSCPICLDSYTSPRLTKCGHTFCYPCILHHLHSLGGTNAQRSQCCPCCCHLVCVDDLRPVSFQSVSAPRVGRKMVFRRLEKRKKSGMAPGRRKDDEVPIVTDEDARFCRLNYEDEGRSFIMNKLDCDIAELERLLKSGVVGTELQFVSMALDAVRVERESTLRELGGVGVAIGETGDNSMGFLEKARKSDISLAAEIVEEESLSQFYQASDGQLCFLSNFNMRCLTAESMIQSPSDNAVIPSIQPQLPDEIEGQVIDVENIHLTSDVRKRLSFLSHLPLYTDVKVVEINLSRRYLSDETRKQFKGEMEKRKKKRRNKINKEKRADAARREKEERMKIKRQVIDASDDFFHPSLTMESNNEGTSPMSDEFGPSLNPSEELATTADMPSTRVTMQERLFRPPPAVLALQTPKTSPLEAWPDLADAMTSPPPSSAPLRRHDVRRAGPAWGVGSPVKKAAGRSQQGVGGGTKILPSSPTKVGSGAPKGKGKKGRQKVILFSTGGHRGSSYR